MRRYLGSSRLCGAFPNTLGVGFPALGGALSGLGSRVEGLK